MALSSVIKLLFAVTVLITTGVLRAEDPPGYHDWAKKPPMGWNSWDCFATTINEAQTHEQANFMARNLHRFGWEYVVVDIQWYEPQAIGFDYRKDAKLIMDEWGRLLPAENRFPSAANGQGFKSLAAYVHGLGLKFGVHLMRGIPRQAVAEKTRIKGTNFTAADIADTTSTCAWNGDMYGVDMSKPGAQEYYNSVLELLAWWDLDFVKIDDLSFPYHQAEIAALRTAIDRTGRSIVLSTSPGPTPVADGGHVSTHANMWRISGDFWDNWPQLLSQFERLNAWTPYRGPGHFPDADMLPLGTISMGKRKTNFTPDEQLTLMSLWCVARSPLVLGADLTKLDDATLALITNEDALAVNQASANNRQLFNREGFYGWVADVPGTPDRYVALFNTRARPGSIAAEKAVFSTALLSRRDHPDAVRVEVELGGASKLYLVGDGDADGVWSEAVLATAEGSRKLGDLPWVSAKGGTLTPAGIEARGKSIIEYDLPVGSTRFQAFVKLSDNGGGKGRNASSRFLVFTQPPLATETSAPVAVEWSELGLQGACTVRDLWRKKELGEMTGGFAPSINAHGAGLYRISPPISR